MSATNWTAEGPDTAGMTRPVRCTHCGKTYDLAKVIRTGMASCNCGARITNDGSPPHPVNRSQWSWVAVDGVRPGNFWCLDGALHAPASSAGSSMWRAPCCDVLVDDRGETDSAWKSVKDYVRLDR